jgi:hypothetical protein
MNRTKRLIWIVLLLGIVMVAGCGTKPADDAESGRTGSGQATEQNEAWNEITIKLYYTDEQMETLHETTGTIRYKDDQEKYIRALEALTDSEDATLYPLWIGLTVRDAAIDHGRLTVNLDLADEGRLGAWGEQLALDALKQTLFQFAEIDEIEILVGGEPVDSLMGHVELEHPIRRQAP